VKYPNLVSNNPFRIKEKKGIRNRKKVTKNPGIDRLLQKVWRKDHFRLKRSATRRAHTIPKKMKNRHRKITNKQNFMYL
jgi:hypothetical protein